MSGAEEFDRFRGEFPRATISTRQVAGTLTTPGCERRRVLDLAEVDLRALASLLSLSAGKQSSFAITRTRTFEAKVFENGMAAVIALARQHLGLDLGDVAQTTVDAASVRAVTPTLGATQIADVRANTTRRLLEQMLNGEGHAVNLVRKPLTTIQLGDRRRLIEQDMLIFASTTHRIHLVEVRDYTEIDGVHEGSKVSQTLREAAVALISLRQMATELGFDPMIISSNMLLITPKQLTLTPVGRVLNLSNQARRLEMLVERIPVTPAAERWIGDLAAMPPMPAKDATEQERDSAQVSAWEAVASIPSRLGEGCPSCPLHKPCRDEAHNAAAVEALGPVAAQTCGTVLTIDRALGLARGDAPEGAEEVAVATALTRARTALRTAFERAESANAQDDTEPEPGDRPSQGVS
jgi:hypothetical protein